jgi:arsenate reductase (thioredoxin)
MRTVLFLGSYNATRTQMAEAILRHRAAYFFEPHSAGLKPTEVHPMTKYVLEEIGIDVEPLWSKDLRNFLGRKMVHCAIILSKRDEPYSPRLYPFSLNTLYWPFDNPDEGPVGELNRLNAFRLVRDLITRQIDAWVAKELAGSGNMAITA